MSAVWLDPDAIPKGCYFVLYHGRNGYWSVRLQRYRKDGKDFALKSRQPTLEAALEGLKAQVQKVTA